MQAARAAAATAREAPLNTRSKGVAANIVTDADAAAERAAVALLQTHRPRDAIVGEEGTDRNAGSARRWFVDSIDGTVAFANRLGDGWCSAVVLVDADGPRAAAVIDARGELYAAERGRGATCDGEPIAVRAPRDLDDAHVAAFFRRDRLVLPGVRELAHALLDRAGLLRHSGPGSLELAWVAAGRLDGWIQPATDPWDWLPGALLVTEAGGEARVVGQWHIAGPSPVVDALVSLLT